VLGFVRAKDFRALELRVRELEAAAGLRLEPAFEANLMRVIEVGRAEGMIDPPLTREPPRQ
jgi:hypothetical protein